VAQLFSLGHFDFMKITYTFNGQPSAPPKFIDDGEFANVDLALAGLVRALSKVKTADTQERPTLSIIFGDGEVTFKIGGSPAAVRLANERLGFS